MKNWLLVLTTIGCMTLGLLFAVQYRCTCQAERQTRVLRLRLAQEEQLSRGALQVSWAWQDRYQELLRYAKALVALLEEEQQKKSAMPLPWNKRHDPVEKETGGVRNISL